MKFFNRSLFIPNNSAYQVSVLLVCTANYCRSPMAEGIFRQELLKRGLSQHIRVDSAGTHVSRRRKRPDIRAQQAVLTSGLNIYDLRSRSIELVDFAEFDYILAMDNGNYNSLSNICPDTYQHKLAMMMSYSSQAGVTEVPDPYYSNKAGFQQVYTFLEQAVKGLVDSIEIKYNLL